MGSGPRFRRAWPMLRARGSAEEDAALRRVAQEDPREALTSRGSPGSGPRAPSSGPNTRATRGTGGACADGAIPGGRVLPPSPTRLARDLGRAAGHLSPDGRPVRSALRGGAQHEPVRAWGSPVGVRRGDPPGRGHNTARDPACGFPPTCPWGPTVLGVRTSLPPSLADPWVGEREKRMVPCPLTLTHLCPQGNVPWCRWCLGSPGPATSR